MPRSLKEVIEHGEQLAARLDALEPGAGDIKDGEVLAELRGAVLDRAAQEARIAGLVKAARLAGHSWSAIAAIAAIAAMLGTSGEAARQHYAEIAATN